MNKTPPVSIDSRLSWKHISLALAAVAAFELAYSIHALGFLILFYLACLFELIRLPSSRLAFYFGLAIGTTIGALQAGFFWTIFGAGAISLWLILGFWIGLFLAFARLIRGRFGKLPALILIPFLWIGLEYFRSELYYLRFSWLNAGYVFSDYLAWIPMRYLGMYGIGFCMMALLSLTALLRRRARLIARSLLLLVLGVLTVSSSLKQSPSLIQPVGNLHIAGVQLEFPSEPVVIDNLNRLLIQHPEAQLLVLSEYTFTDPIPNSVKAWCRKNQRHLIVGGKDPVSDSQYYDTAFVINPQGEIIFQQIKCVPIQFFKDGLPAKEQKLWNSPWGKIGICICYDLSYTRVTDELIRLGAQAIIVPSMDIMDWGRHQHELHARVAPIRAAEYGVPIFRLASSGISQCVATTGQVLADAPMPGDGAVISGTLNLDKPGSLPLDRYLAPFSVAVTGLIVSWLAFSSLTKRKNHHRSKN